MKLTYRRWQVLDISSMHGRKQRQVGASCRGSLGIRSSSAFAPLTPRLFLFFLFSLLCSACRRIFRCIHISIDRFADHDARLTSAARRAKSHTPSPVMKPDLIEWHSDSGSTIRWSMARTCGRLAVPPVVRGLDPRDQASAAWIDKCVSRIPGTSRSHNSCMFCPNCSYAFNSAASAPSRTC